MTGFPSISDFVLVVAAALAGGALAKGLRQPPVLGYLVAGLVIGPHVTGLIHDSARVNTLAQLGVAFLMFQAGTELSFHQLRSMQGFVLLGPVVQLLFTAPFVVLAVLLFRFPVSETSYLGLILALSSTTVVVKLLAQRGETDTLHGRLATAFSIVQDLPLVPAIVILTSLSTVGQQASGGALALTILIALGKAVAFVVIAYSLGTKIVPPLLRRVAAHGRELFLLCAVALALGMAYVTNLLGLSLVLGAFIAGLVVADSEVSQQVLREVSPISDVFITFFFASVGMLLDIPFVLQHVHGVVIVVVLVLVGKSLMLTLIGLLFRYSGRTSLMIGLSLAQIGEEAFVLAQVGLSQGVLRSNSYSLVLAGAVISIVLSPPLVEMSPGILRLLQRIPGLRWPFVETPRAYLKSRQDGLREHTIVCGYGAVGRELIQALERRGLKYLVIEQDSHLIEQLRKRETPCIYGDAGTGKVLDQANIRGARSLAVTVPDSATAERIVRSARRVRQGIDIVVRASGADGTVTLLQEAGASQVINPSFEASVEFIRAVLLGNGVPPREVEKVLLAKRLGFYG